MSSLSFNIYEFKRKIRWDFKNWGKLHNDLGA
jgi:hypothetical protein